jgi:hypothetical protein
MANKQLTNPDLSVKAFSMSRNETTLAGKEQKMRYSREDNTPKTSKRRRSASQTPKCFKPVRRATSKSAQIDMEIVGKVAINYELTRSETIDSTNKYQTLAESTGNLNRKLFEDSQSLESLRTPIISTVKSHDLPHKISTFTSDSQAGSDSKSAIQSMTPQEYRAAVMASRSIKYRSSRGYPGWCNNYIVNGYRARTANQTRATSPGESFNSFISNTSSKTPSKPSPSFFRPSSSTLHRKALSLNSSVPFSSDGMLTKMSIVNISEVHKPKYHIRPKFRIIDQVAKVMNPKYNTLVYDINT